MRRHEEFLAALNSIARDFPHLVLRKADFTLGEVCGGGGFGVVLRAKMLSTGRECAVKQLFEESLLRSNAHRFIAEIRTMAVCSNPFIVPFVGFTMEDPYCIITEFMVEGTLDHYI
jgi:serine/threonine protein kinase